MFDKNAPWDFKAIGPVTPKLRNSVNTAVSVR